MDALQWFSRQKCASCYDCMENYRKFRSFNVTDDADACHGHKMVRVGCKKYENLCQRIQMFSNLCVIATCKLNHYSQ